MAKEGCGERIKQVWRTLENSGLGACPEAAERAGTAANRHSAGVERRGCVWPPPRSPTWVAAEEVIADDEHARGLPQAPFLEHDLPWCGAKRAARSVRREACGARRVAGVWAAGGGEACDAR